MMSQRRPRSGDRSSKEGLLRQLYCHQEGRSYIRSDRRKEWLLCALVDRLGPRQECGTVLHGVHPNGQSHAVTFVRGNSRPRSFEAQDYQVGLKPI